MRLVRHAHGIEDIRDPSVRFRTILPACGLEHERKVFLHAPVHQQLEILEHYAEPAAEVGDFLGAYRPQVVPADPAVSLYKRVLGDYRPDDGCLPCTYLSHYIHEVARVDIHVQPVYYAGFSVEYVSIPERYDWCPFFHFHNMNRMGFREVANIIKLAVVL